MVQLLILMMRKRRFAVRHTFDFLNSHFVVSGAFSMSSVLFDLAEPKKLQKKPKTKLANKQKKYKQKYEASLVHTHAHVDRSTDRAVAV